MKKGTAGEQPSDTTRREPWLGSLGRLSLLAWMLGMVLMAPGSRLWLSAALCLATAACLHPASFRQLLRGRVLLLLGLILAASLGLSTSQPDAALWGIPYSLPSLKVGLQMVVRAIVILVAVDGFSNAVEISELAGMVERLGLRGLGFSIGVAFNLMPTLRQAGMTTWHALWMRGGLRRSRLHSLRLLVVTIVSNALRRGDEIALAAEARAFTPERSRLLPLRGGRLDHWLLVPLAVSLLALLLIPPGSAG
jgi:energy-coupling factor transporter transmembrane protein EcfT